MEQLNDYYRLDDIDATGCNYRIILSERGNGKTYAVKEKAIKEFGRTGKQFFYLRRYVEEIRPSKMNQLFADMSAPLNELRASKYPEFDMLYVQAKSGEFKIVGENTETGDKKVVGILGHYGALRQEQYIKSVSYPDVNMMCFDEVLTKSATKSGELMDFLNIISTVRRRRTDFTIYLLGNTINRHSRLLEEMGVKITDVEPGRIDCWQYFGPNGEINTLAYERCRHYEQSTESAAYSIFGDHKTSMMINNGEWQINDYPLFSSEEFASAKLRYGVVLEHKKLRLFCYITSDGDIMVTDKRQRKAIDFVTITDKPTYFNRKQFCFRGHTLASDSVLRYIFLRYCNQHVRFKSNICGDDFDEILVRFGLMDGKA